MGDFADQILGLLRRQHGSDFIDCHTTTYGQRRDNGGLQGRWRSGSALDPMQCLREKVIEEVGSLYGSNVCRARLAVPLYGDGHACLPSLCEQLRLAFDLFLRLFVLGFGLVVRPTLASVLEFPNAFAESFGNFWEFLTAKEEHGDNENEH
jgi:hypothetical protein